MVNLPNIKCHENLSNRSQLLPVRQTWTCQSLQSLSELCNCMTRASQKGFKLIISPSEYWNMLHRLTCVSICVAERKSTYSFLQPQSLPLPASLGRTPVRYMTHTMLIAGSRVTVPGMDSHQQSGYQVLRLATELVPSTLALLGVDTVSPFWAILLYFVLMLFGIAQQVCSISRSKPYLSHWKACTSRKMR